MIDLGRYADMDVGMLYSLINMQLHNAGADLDGFTRGHVIDHAALEVRMAQDAYRYVPATRQFRAAG